jgi:hypothetical protein
MAPTTARSRSAAMLRRRAAAAALCGCGGGSNQASAAVIARAFVPPNTRGLGAAGPRGGRLATKLSKADGCERPMAHGAAPRARSVTTVSLSGQQSRVRSCLALPVENETAEERKQLSVAAGRVRLCRCRRPSRSSARVALRRRVWRHRAWRCALLRRSLRRTTGRAAPPLHVPWRDAPRAFCAAPQKTTKTYSTSSRKRLRKSFLLCVAAAQAHTRY